ncbi:MAG TPA: hypothetical protein VJL29_09325 [Thermoguttaceae bacterium]|nr:hypothetical protein [Thermoguttaceae bacterium]
MPQVVSPNTAAPTRPSEIIDAILRQREELETFLAAQRERMTGAESRLAGQIRRISQELSKAQSEIDHVREQQAARGEQLALEAESIAQLIKTLEAAQAQWRESQNQAARQQRELADEIHASQESLTRRFDELAERQSRVAEDEARLHLEWEKLALVQSQTDEQDHDLADAQRTLRARLDEALDRSAELERRLREAEAAVPTDEDGEDYRGRYRTAVENLEQLRERNEELEKQVRQSLEQQSDRPAPAPAAGEADEHDAILYEERETLRRLQKELEDKLRQAEIEISIERADMARQRVEMEEIMRQFAETDVPLNSGSLPGSATEVENASGRRWLARLGLKKLE